MEIDVRHIAKLSYLKIEDDEIGTYQKQMSDIIQMVEALPDQADFDAKPRVEDAMQLREDEIRPSTPRDKLLQNAPQVEAGCVIVPKTLE